MQNTPSHGRKKPKTLPHFTVLVVFVNCAGLALLFDLLRTQRLSSLTGAELQIVIAPIVASLVLSVLAFVGEYLRNRRLQSRMFRTLEDIKALASEKQSEERELPEAANQNETTEQVEDALQQVLEALEASRRERHVHRRLLFKYNKALGEKKRLEADLESVARACKALEAGRRKIKLSSGNTVSDEFNSMVQSIARSASPTTTENSTNTNEPGLRNIG